ncbi:two-component hybrid sensor and regulator [Leptolyngbya sp. NIES-3755]|nr:two-component hybrid sensor and regulator [Leptolyngbya sp. NIES-3755]
MRHPERILLIDDNPDDRALIIRELRREFPQVEITEIVNAQGFNQALEADQFDVVITDYQLLWTNGIKVLQAVKARYPYQPVIMFSSTGTQQTAIDAMKAGLDDYVIKSPRHYIRLTVSVKAMMAKVEMQQQTDLLQVRLQSLLDRLDLGIFRTRLNGELIDANPAFLRMLGVESIQEAQVGMENDALWRYEQNPIQMQQLQADPRGVEREILLRRRDGQTIWVLLSETLSTIGAETVVDGLMENISQRKQQEAEIRQLTETLEQRVSERTAQLEEANQQLEAFSYSVSHDLREPLRVIEGYAQAVLDDFDPQLDPVAQTYLHRIIIGTQRLETLIQNLLTYSQLSRGEMPLQPLSLATVIQEVLTELQPAIAAQQATITVAELLPAVQANYLTLVQVITNVLSNAIKFVPPNVRPQVTVRAEERLDRVRLWVEDNGIGVPSESRERIFQVFDRLHGSDIYPGTGIGLAIVRKGVERMGGRVGLESGQDQGTRFWIELPLFKRDE